MRTPKTEKFSLSLHPNNKSEKYARCKSPKTSVSRTEENQQMVIRRIRGKSLHRFQMVYKFVTTRHRNPRKDIETAGRRYGRIVQ